MVLDKGNVIAQLRVSLQPHLDKDKISWDKASPLLRQMPLEDLQSALDSTNVQPFWEWVKKNNGLQGGSINKMQLIKEQIKIIKDKYKNTKLDKYLIQIDNLKHKIILQTFTDKLLKIKEQIKNYKTEMKANPNKKDKYIKNIDKLVERFNVLKQEQDTLKQNIKLKPTKDPKPTKNPTKDPKSTKISKTNYPSQIH